MNARQRAKFEERFADKADSPEILRVAEIGYSAACQDEAEAVKGLVEALQEIEAHTDKWAGKVAAAALAKWKGEQ